LIILKRRPLATKKKGRRRQGDAGQRNKKRIQKANFFKNQIYLGAAKCFMIKNSGLLHLDLKYLKKYLK